MSDIEYLSDKVDKYYKMLVIILPDMSALSGENFVRIVKNIISYVKDMTPIWRLSRLN